MHFLRWLGISIVMGIIPLVFIVWFMIACSATGRRKRDILFLLIPIYGIYFSIQTIWRYTAKNVYWSVRDDRPSKSLFSGA
jgi:membrane protein implicated in regulation of membrane protease activity